MHHHITSTSPCTCNANINTHLPLNTQKQVVIVMEARKPWRANSSLLEEHASSAKKSMIKPPYVCKQRK